MQLPIIINNQSDVGAPRLRTRDSRLRKRLRLIELVNHYHLWEYLSSFQTHIPVVLKCDVINITSSWLIKSSHIHSVRMKIMACYRPIGTGYRWTVHAMPNIVSMKHSVWMTHTLWFRRFDLSNLFFIIRIILLNSSLHSRAIVILVLVLRMGMSHHDSYTGHITHVYD